MFLDFRSPLYIKNGVWQGLGAAPKRWLTLKCWLTLRKNIHKITKSKYTVGILNIWITNLNLFATQMPANSLLFKPWSE